MMDEAGGELVERRLDHQSGEADAFYRSLQGPVRVGIEATGKGVRAHQLRGAQTRVSVLPKAKERAEDDRWGVRKTHTARIGISNGDQE